MYEYHVALALKDSPYRLDVYVQADSESDAKAEAMRQVPKGDKVTKVISIERR